MNQKFNQVVFHFGSDKTGSTTIQTTFREARQLLLEKGLLAYPEDNHGFLGSYFCEEAPEKYVLNAAAHLSDQSTIRKRDALFFNKLTQWIESIPCCHTLLFSFEGFLSMNEKAMQKMREFAYTLAKDVKVILYIRPPLSFAVSHMSQRVKSGRKSFEEPAVWNYRHNIEKCTSVFGADHFHLRVFSPKTLKNQDVVEDFADFLGFPNDLISGLPTLHANQSLTAVGAKVGDALIDLLKEHAIQMNHNEFFKQFGHLLMHIPGGKIKLLPDQAQQILDLSQQSCTFLKEAFGIEFNEDMHKHVYASEEEFEAERKIAFAFSTVLRNFCTQVYAHKLKHSKSDVLSILKQKLQKLRIVKRLKEPEAV